MNPKLPIEIATELISLIDYFQTITQVSWGYKQLKENYPVSTISEKDALSMIKGLQDLKAKTKRLAREAK